MTIGIDITPVTRASTGVGFYTRHLLRELAALDTRESFRGFAAGMRPLDQAHIPFPYVRIPVPSRAMYWLWDRTGHPRVDSLLGGLDVFHAVNYVLPPLASARGVLTIHDLGFLRNPDWFSPKIMAPFTRSIRRDAQRADAIIAVSEATRDDITAFLDVPKERIHVIYEAADDAFAPVPRERAAHRVQEALGIQTPYLLFVSTVEARKNVTGLLTAFARADIPHSLVIAGAPGWRSDEAYARAEALNLGNRVLFTGYLSDRDLFPSLYSAAEAFVFPSWHEGFGLAVLEAMSCGCPVIASGRSSLPEVGGDAALYTDPEDADDLARKMECVASDEGLRATMCEKGLAWANRFSWRKCAEETLACYRSLL